MPRSGEGRGFSLIEYAAVLAALLILAGAMVPLAMKGITQRREGRTRDLLRQAFTGLFGALDHREANLRADIGFNPTASLADLSILVAKSGSGGAWSGVKEFGPDADRGLFWGYNGPYWSGPLSGTVPVDAWGRPLRLRVTGLAPNHAWQLQSFGANGRDENGGGDDLVYPPSPADAAAFTSVLNLDVQNPGGTSFTVVGYAPNPVGTALQVANHVAPPPAGSLITLSGTRSSTVAFNPPSGAFVVSIASGSGTRNYLFDLNPGEIRDVQAVVLPGTCSTPSVPVIRSAGYSPAEDVTIVLSWGGSQSQTVTTKYNNGHPEGQPVPIFTDLPQGVTISVQITSDKRGTLAANPSSFTLDSACSAPTITF